MSFRKFDTDEDAQLVISVDPDGIGVGTADNPFITEDHSDAIADQLVTGAASYSIDGYLAVVPESKVLTDISELGVTQIPIPQVATAMKIKSTSANDAAAGSGARTVHINGLDANYLEIDEVVTLNGTSFVNLVNSYLRINNMHVMTVGSFGATAAGDITLVDQATGLVVYDIIKTGGNADLQAHFTVPAGKVGSLETWDGSAVTATKNTYGRIILRSTSDWHTRDNLPGVYNFQRTLVGADMSQSFLMVPHLLFKEKTDIKASAQMISSAVGGMAASVNFNIIVRNA